MLNNLIGLLLTCFASTALASGIDPLLGLLHAEKMNPNFSFTFPFLASDISKVVVANGIYNFLLYPGPGNSDSPMFWHDGLDLRIPAGTPVYSQCSGFVSVREAGKYHSSVSIDETNEAGDRVGRLWTFTHIEMKTVSAEVLAAIAQQKIILKNTHLANVVRWVENEPGIPDQISVYDNLRYDHIHVTAKVDDNFVNLSRYAKYQDDVPPHIQNIYFVKNNTVEAVVAEGSHVRGEVDVAVENLDFVTGNPFPFTGVVQGKIEILDDSASVVFQRELVLPRILGDVNALYFQKLNVNGQTIRAVGDQFDRKSFFNFMHLDAIEKNGTTNAQGTWDTSLVPAGRYKLKVTIGDAKDNFSTQQVEFFVEHN